MKRQHISRSEYMSLSNHDRELLARWYEKELGQRFTDFTELTIGEMIQLISKKLNSISTWDNNKYRICLYKQWGIKNIKNIELCDGLWEVIKQILDRFEYMRIDL